MTSQTRLAHTAGFLHLGQSRRRAAAVNMPGCRTCRPGLNRGEHRHIIHSGGTPLPTTRSTTCLHSHLDKLGQCPAVTLRSIASPTARNRSIGSNPDGLCGAEGKTAHSSAADPMSWFQLLTMAGA